MADAEHRSWWTHTLRPGPPQVVQQTHVDGCGPACGEMLLRDRGFEVDQELIAQGLTLPVTARELAVRMCALAPARWLGAFLSIDGGGSWSSVAGISAERGSWGALLEPNGYRVAGHWVVVDGVSPEGTVWIRDPRGEAYGIPMLEFLGVWRYTVMVIEEVP